MPATATKTEHRPLAQIAREIQRDWMEQYKKIGSTTTDKFYAARPYLNAMMALDQIDGNFYDDTAQDIVLRFLTNSATWRGETARRVKAELKAILRGNGYPIK